jgi:hypothetical protein
MTTNTDLQAAVSLLDSVLDSSAVHLPGELVELIDAFLIDFYRSQEA